jgi:hypothetical protein
VWDALLWNEAGELTECALADRHWIVASSRAFCVRRFFEVGIGMKRSPPWT